MEFAMLMISSASFISGSARGLYGFGGGDSSAEVGKLLVRSHKASTEAKKSKTITTRSTVIFGGQEPPKIRPLPPKKAIFGGLWLIFGGSWPPEKISQK
jgi:hypothetical protein